MVPKWRMIPDDFEYFKITQSVRYIVLFLLFLMKMQFLFSNTNCNLKNG